MPLNRRQFLAQTAMIAAAGCVSVPTEPAEPIIDIHQHTKYLGRTNRDLIRHQRNMGVTQTVLLPAGKYYGLDAECGDNESALLMVKAHRREYLFFANEMPYQREMREVISRYLKQGAIGIGEQKFRVLADSAHLDKVATIAKEFDVPVLLHFWDPDYNMELERFAKILQKFPTVNFIGHAQTWWGHIDQKYDRRTMYPKGRVTAGGLTDRLLADYGNMYADLSAHSGLNALTRDPEFTQSFFDRHQSKIMFGSDCPDAEGSGPKCTGAQILAAVRQFSPIPSVVRKILHDNAHRVLRLGTLTPLTTAAVSHS